MFRDLQMLLCPSIHSKVPAASARQCAARPGVLTLPLSLWRVEQKSEHGADKIRVFASLSVLILHSCKEINMFSMEIQWLLVQRFHLYGSLVAAISVFIFTLIFLEFFLKIFVYICLCVRLCCVWVCVMPFLSTNFHFFHSVVMWCLLRSILVDIWFICFSNFEQKIKIRIRWLFSST